MYGDAVVEVSDTMLIYRYYKDDGTLIQSENIPVVKDGMKGDDGEQGGAYYGTTQPTLPNTNDFYLDIVQMKLFYWNGDTWIEDTQVTPPSFRWNTAVNDCLAVANASGNVLTASKAWVGSLVASNIFVNELNGVNATFENITISGQSKFEGAMQNTTLTAQPADLEYFEYEGELIGCSQIITFLGSRYTDGVYWYQRARILYYDMQREKNFMDFYFCNKWGGSYITYDRGINWYVGFETRVNIKGYYAIDKTKLFNEVFMNITNPTDFRGVEGQTYSPEVLLYGHFGSLYVDKNGFVKMILTKGNTFPVQPE